MKRDRWFNRLVSMSLSEMVRLKYHSLWHIYSEVFKQKIRCPENRKWDRENHCTKTGVAFQELLTQQLK